MQKTSIRNCFSRWAVQGLDHLENNGWELLEHRRTDGDVSVLSLKRDHVSVTLILRDGRRLEIAVVSSKFPELSVIDVAELDSPEEVTERLDWWVADLGVQLQ